MSVFGCNAHPFYDDVLFLFCFEFSLITKVLYLFHNFYSKPFEVIVTNYSELCFTFENYWVLIFTSTE